MLSFELISELSRNYHEAFYRRALTKKQQAEGSDFLVYGVFIPEFLKQLVSFMTRNHYVEHLFQHRT